MSEQSETRESQYASTPGFYGETLFTIPNLNMRVVQTPQGWAYEWDDIDPDDKPRTRHSWPDSMQRDLITAYRQEIDAKQKKIEQLRELLKSLICRNCENRIGFTGEPTVYGDWRKCATCAPVRAVLASKGDECKL